MSLVSPSVNPSDRTFAAAIITAFVLVTLFITLYHEPWRDEADSWLIVRDGGMSAVLARTGYAGTPSLWYFLVGALVKSGLPFFWQSLLNLLLAWGAVSLFVFYAPFSRLTRALFAFSYYPAYEYSVIARPYALMMLLMFAIALCWKQRRERAVTIGILVALLANTTSHGLIIAALTGAVFALDAILTKPVARRAGIAAGVMIAGGIVSYLQLRTPADAPFPDVVRDRDFSRAAWAVGNAFFPSVEVRLSAAMALIVLAALTMAMRRRPIYAAMLWIGVAVLFGVFAFVWMGGLRHSGVVLMFAIFVLWIAGIDDQRWTRIAVGVLSVAFAVSIVPAAIAWSNDYKMAFSGGREMARYIVDHRLQKYDIAAHNIPTSEPVLPYLEGKQFWYPGWGRYGSFMPFDREYERGIRVPYIDAIQIARWHFAGKPWLLLLNAPLDDPYAMGFTLLYTNQTPVYGIDDERFWLYAPLEAPLPENVIADRTIR